MIYIQAQNVSIKEKMLTLEKMFSMFVKFKVFILSVVHPEVHPVPVVTEVNEVGTSIKFKEWRI